MRIIDQRYYQLKIALAMLLGVIAFGSLGYMIIEGWNLLDSVYMTIISITTTGYREVYPLSQLGKMFTLLIIILGVVTIAYAGGRLAQLFVESYLFRRRKMVKQLSTLENHYIICGYGFSMQNTHCRIRLWHSNSKGLELQS